jgi:cyclophilin family peptidyl-prolyl cis-trans isomerase
LSRRQRRPIRRPRSRAGPPFPINVIFNVRAFYVAFIVVIIASMAAVGLGGVVEPNTQRTTKPTDEKTPTPEATPALQYRTYEAPEQVIDPAKTYVATIRTEKGEIKLRLRPDKAPKAANSFAFLAQQGFYDGLTFHIVRPDVGFVQGGDPTCRADGSLVCTGAGGPGYTLPVEGDLQHVRGMVAMAPIAGGRDVSGSQFYILLADMPHMDGRDSVFAEVVAGMEVVQSFTPRNPCFEKPSKDNPCQESPSPGDTIIEIVVQEG